MIIEFLIAIGITGFLLLYFFNSVDREHWLLKILIAFIFLGTLILIPKVIVDNPNTCQIVLANETTNSTYTTYQYTNFCITNPNTTHISLYKSVIWFIRLFAIYIFLYFNYVFWLKNKLIRVGLIKK